MIKRYLLGAAALVAASTAAMSARAVEFVVDNLASDGSVPAAHTDSNLVNPWGVSFAPMSPFWISDNATGFTSLKTGTGAAFAALPQVSFPAAAANPTGQVFNTGLGSNAFQIGGQTPIFLFAGEDGHISGWDFAAGTTAQIGFTTSAGAVFKGLAIASSGANTMLYAADFHNNSVDMFTNDLSSFTTFTDPSVLPGYAPFNTQVLAGKLYVTFALQDAFKHDDVAAEGNGYVDVFNLDGTLDHRIASQGDLNLDSPWGLAIAPSTFGAFAGDLLVGNFGDGTISVYNPTTNAFLGKLDGLDGKPLALGDLWALTPGNGFVAGRTDRIYFTSGLVEESGGLFGDIRSVPEPQIWSLLIAGFGLMGATLRARRTRLAPAG